jgi:hypothetical protein
LAIRNGTKPALRIGMPFSEIRYSLRNLRRAPGFALTAILTLALGIGASTTLFTIVESVVLKPLTYCASGNLVVIWERVKFLASRSIPYVGPNSKHEAIWKDRSSAFSNLCLLDVDVRGVSLGSDHPRLVGNVRAQPNFLDLLEVTPLLGRGFIPGDAVEGHDHVAILAYSMWRTLLHGDPGAIGKSVRIGDTPYEVIGVLPKNFQFPKRNVLNSFPSKQGATTAPPD